MEERAILHCDLNNFFASVECTIHPQYKDKPLVVAGAPEERRGVVLAKNYIAKSFGIVTGDTVFQAKQKCPQVIVRTPIYKLYNLYSSMVRQIYLKYTNLVESFSIDECWLDVTNSKMFGTPFEIANIIREEVKKVTGLTISVGVSFNKIFSKIGSDLKKPDAVSVITKENYKQIVWPLPIEAMLGIGRKNTKKLNRLGIITLGDLAKFDRNILLQLLGVVGGQLHDYSNGIDNSPVRDYNDIVPPKSVGNSTTYYKDLVNNDEVMIGLTVLAESISERLWEYDVTNPRTLTIKIKNSSLNSIYKQCPLVPCKESSVIAKTAFNLFKQIYDWKLNVRQLGITVSNFEELKGQITMLDIQTNNAMDKTIIKIRRKYGHNIIGKCNTLVNTQITNSFHHSSLEKNKIFEE